MGAQRKIRVAVVFGGRSAEHAVSCASAGLFLAAIDRDKYDVVPIGIARDGRWVLTSGDVSRLALSEGELPSVEAVATPGVSVTPQAGPGGRSLVFSGPAAVPPDLGEVDVVVPLLHGAFGEDGTIQGLLELAGVPYVGAGVLSSALSMDKEYMKLVFAAKGLPVGRFVVLRPQDWPTGSSLTGEDEELAGHPERKRVFGEIADLGWPLFVKPARGGSSIGTSKAHDLDQLRTSIALARSYDPKVLVEAAVDGREIEVSVLEGIDGAPPDTSLPGQLMIDGGEEFWDFEAKYLDAASGMEIPAPIPAAATVEIRRLAAAAFDAVSCEGLARVDFFYTDAGQILINEINTIPGLSPASYFQKMWEATGLPFPQLIDRLLQTALRKGTGLR